MIEISHNQIQIFESMRLFCNAQKKGTLMYYWRTPAELSSSSNMDIDADIVVDGSDVFYNIIAGNFKKVVVVAGTKINTDSGIPNWTNSHGLSHASLQENPVKFALAVEELYVGIKNSRIASTHRFIKMLDSVNLLHCCITQNVDCLELLAGVNETKVVHVYGRFDKVTCGTNKCTAEHDPDNYYYTVMKRNQERYGVSPVYYSSKYFLPRCKQCWAPLRPNITLKGDIPTVHKDLIKVLKDCDLVLILGSNLDGLPISTYEMELPKTVPVWYVNTESPSLKLLEMRELRYIQGSMDEAFRKFV